MNKFMLVEAIHNGDIVKVDTLSEIAKYIGSDYNSLLRSNRRKSIVKNKYNVVKVGQNPNEFNKIFEYFVCDITDNDLIVMVGTRDYIVEKLNISSSRFSQVVCDGTAYEGKYKIYKIIEDYC